MKRPLMVVTVVAIVAACGPGGERTGQGPDQTSGAAPGSPSPTDSGQQPAPEVKSRDLERLEVEEGVAAVELEVSPDVVASGTDIGIVLTNLGDVELLTGEAFTVGRWNGAEWVDVTSSGALSAFPDIGIVLRPGGTWSQSWPSGFRDDHLDPGQYQLMKEATYSAPDRADHEFVLRAGFEVAG